MAKVPLSDQSHRGVKLYEQPSACMERARRQIDHVLGVRDVDALIAIIEGGPRWSAESRQLAFALLKAQWAQCADEGKVRPNVDLADIESHIAHLNTSWMTLIETWPPRCDDEANG